jgi:hypothetical protein
MMFESLNNDTIIERVIDRNGERPAHIAITQIENGNTLCYRIIELEYDQNGRLVKVIGDAPIQMKGHCSHHFMNDDLVTQYFYDYSGRLVEIWIERQRSNCRSSVIRRYRYDLRGNWTHMYERRPGEREYLATRRHIKYAEKLKYGFLIW